jgi:hypothetical protein
VIGPAAPFPCYRVAYEEEAHHPGWSIFVMREYTGDGRVLDIKEMVPVQDMAHPLIRAIVWSMMDARMEEGKMRMVEDDRSQA